MERSNLRLGGLLGVDGGLLAHSSEHDNVCEGWLAAVRLRDSSFSLLVSFSSSRNSLLIFCPTSSSGILTSSLVSPLSVMRFKKPSSEMSS